MWSIVKKAGVVTLAVLLCASVPAIAAAKTTVKNHTMAGTVKSIDANTLVLSRTGKKADVTFALDSKTKKNGTLEVGTPVSVTYHMNGAARDAVAVTAKSTKTAQKK